MSSNGYHSTAPESGILLAPELIAAAMESINVLSVWLKEAGLDENAIAQFKFNALARKFPDLADIIEEAKKLIGAQSPIPELGMTATEVAQRLTDDLGRKIKPAEVNQALVELEFQVRPENGKRIWQLTESGKEYGMSRLATSKTNDWSGPQVTWLQSVILPLTDYFESIDESRIVEKESSPTLDSPTPSEPIPKSSLVSETDSKSFSLSERLKVLKKKVTAQQRLHIEMEAAEAYKQQHGKPPAKEQSQGKYYDVYPATALDLVDGAIEQVLKRYAK